MKKKRKNQRGVWGVDAAFLKSPFSKVTRSVKSVCSVFSTTLLPRGTLRGGPRGIGTITMCAQTGLLKEQRKGSGKSYLRKGKGGGGKLRVHRVKRLQVLITGKERRPQKKKKKKRGRVNGRLRILEVEESTAVTRRRALVDDL